FVTARVDAIDGDQRAERGIERSHAELRDKPTADHNEHRTNLADNHTNQRNRHRRPSRAHFFGVIHGLQ
ncbi:hypothetical protein, partial [Escherichia coli]|uniref:hypothetical protein n=1 Tax=Escherichia coli TaxID=562 RepID=UPI001BC86696